MDSLRVEDNVSLAGTVISKGTHRSKVRSTNGSGVTRLSDAYRNSYIVRADSDAGGEFDEMGWRRDGAKSKSSNAFMRFLHAFVVDDDSDDERMAKAVLTIMTSVTIVAGALWGLSFRLFHQDWTSAAVCWSFCAVMAVGLAHLAATRTTRIVAPLFVLNIAFCPILITFSRAGLGPSAVVVLWSLISPVTALIVLYNAPVAGLIHVLVCVTIVAVAVFDSFAEPGWNLLEVKGARQDMRLRNLWLSMNLVVSTTALFAAISHFWHRWRCERRRTRNLLLATYPEDVLAVMNTSAGGVYPALRHEDLGVMFVDIVGFTSWAASTRPATMTLALSEFMREANSLAERHGVERVKMIGDAVLLVAGRPGAEACFRKKMAKAKAKSGSGDGGDDGDNYGDDGDKNGNSIRNGNRSRYTGGNDRRTLRPPKRQGSAAVLPMPRTGSSVSVSMSTTEPTMPMTTTNYNNGAASSEAWGGDSSSAAANPFLPPPLYRLAVYAIALRDLVRARSFAGELFEVRIGLEVGEVIAGVIGSTSEDSVQSHPSSITLAPWVLPDRNGGKGTGQTGNGGGGGGGGSAGKNGGDTSPGMFDILGTTVNRASRIESASSPMRVLASDQFVEKMMEQCGASMRDLVTTGHAVIEAKGIAGGIATSWIERRGAEGV